MNDVNATEKLLLALFTMADNGAYDRHLMDQVREHLTDQGLLEEEVERPTDCDHFSVAGR